MIALATPCEHGNRTKAGVDRKGKRRWRCLDCGRTITDDNYTRPLGDMRIGMDAAESILSLVVEGTSVRAAERLTGTNRSTICDLVMIVGQQCEAWLDRTMVGIRAPEIEMDEIWSFVHCRGKTARQKNYGPQSGNVWSWLAIDSSSKLILAWAMGSRDQRTCNLIMRRLDRAVSGNVHATADGLCLYASQLVRRLGPRATFEKVWKTTFMERFNLTLRTHLRRFVRGTNGHSKSMGHHAAMLALFLAFYNFCRLNTGAGKGVTPAMAAGLTDHVWTIGELLKAVARKEDHESFKEEQGGHAKAMSGVQQLRLPREEMPSLRERMVTERAPQAQENRRAIQVTDEEIPF